MLQVYEYDYIVDPGHGGYDSGSVDSPFVEKDITLMISVYMARRLREHGLRVFLTRDIDRDLPPDARARLVRNLKGKYCISNHINSGGGEGAEVIHSIHDDGTLAKNILNALGSSGQKTRKAYSRKNDKGTDYYYMHRETGSVITNIVEYAFIDCRKDIERFLADWKNYVEAVVRVLVEHVGSTYRGPAPMGGATDSKTASAIDLLSKKGIISSPDYWKKQAKLGQMVQGAYVAQLLEKVAARL